MSALDDARAVLAAWNTTGRIEARDALAALVAECEALRESLTCPLCGDAPLDLRHGGNARILTEAEIREAEAERGGRL